jgi:hypothetical protein
MHNEDNQRFHLYFDQTVNVPTTFTRAVVSHKKNMVYLLNTTISDPSQHSIILTQFGYT